MCIKNEKMIEKNGLNQNFKMANTGDKKYKKRISETDVSMEIDKNGEISKKQSSRRNSVEILYKVK